MSTLRPRRWDERLCDATYDSPIQNIFPEWLNFGPKLNFTLVSVSLSLLEHVYTNGRLFVHCEHPSWVCKPYLLMIYHRARSFLRPRPRAFVQPPSCCPQLANPSLLTASSPATPLLITIPSSPSSQTPHARTMKSSLQGSLFSPLLRRALLRRLLLLVRYLTSRSRIKPRLLSSLRKNSRQRALPPCRYLSAAQQSLGMTTLGEYCSNT